MVQECTSLLRDASRICTRTCYVHIRITIMHARAMFMYWHCGRRRKGQEDGAKEKIALRASGHVVYVFVCMDGFACVGRDAFDWIARLMTQIARFDR